MAKYLVISRVKDGALTLDLIGGRSRGDAAAKVMKGRAKQPAWNPVVLTAKEVTEIYGAIWRKSERELGERFEENVRAGV